MDTLTELYSLEDLHRLRKRTRIWRIALSCFGAGVLLACVILCALTGTANAARMERATILVSTLGGWTVIGLWSGIAAAGRREAAHANNMLTGPRETVSGLVTVTNQRVCIRGSITIRKVLVDTGEKTLRVNLNEARMKAFPAEPKRLTLCTVHNYVVAFGESHEGT